MKYYFILNKKDIKLKYLIIVSSIFVFSFSNSISLNNLKNACIEDKIAEACYELSLMFSQGFGVEKNVSQAKIYSQLAEKYGIKTQLNISENNNTKK